MSDTGEITRWIDGLKAGEKEAARKLWESYFHKLVRLVERRLPSQSRRVFDEEDIALSAFESFCAGVAEERFPELNGRGNLWAILVVIATAKTHAYITAQNRQKRGGGKVRGDSVFIGQGSEEELAGFDAIAGKEPTPAFVAQASETCQHLLDSLGDETLRKLAILKLQGYTIDEIAGLTGCTKRAVQRRLEIIRTTWREQLMQEGIEV